MWVPYYNNVVNVYIIKWFKSRHLSYIVVFACIKHQSYYSECMVLLFSGFLRQPKWGHLKDLHTAIKLCEPALIAVDGSPQYVKLGSMQEVCCRFLAFDFINYVYVEVYVDCPTFFMSSDFWFYCAWNFDRVSEPRGLGSSLGVRSFEYKIVGPLSVHI